MKLSPRRALVLAAAALVVASLARPALATSYVMISDDALARQATVVVDARVVGAEASPVYGGIPATDYRVEVERVLKGSVPGGVITVRVPGGLDESTGVGLKIWGAPEFAAGEQTLLFLRDAGDGTYRVVHLMLGAFHRRELGGRTVALRDLSEAHQVHPGRPDRDGDDADDLRDYAAFSQWLAEGGSGAPADDGYVVGKAPSDLSSVSSGFTLLRPGDGLPIRWFAFDQGTTVPWRVHSGGQPGLGEGPTVAAFQAALQAWDDDPATNIRYAFAGLTDAGGGLAQADGTNAILFDDPFRNDPNEAVEGTFDCGSGGVIAIGGPWYSGRTSTYKGQRYHEALEGDIVTNDGTSCFFANNPLVAQEVFAHELGHTLGLGHSTDRNALMFANAHNDGRGASLTADDRAAVAMLYGGGGGGGNGTLAAPARLTGRATSPTTVALTWRDRASGESGYSVEVRKRRGGWTAVQALDANSTSAVIDGLQPGTRYSFRVRAVAPGAASPYSNVVIVTTPR